MNLLEEIQELELQLQHADAKWDAIFEYKDNAVEEAIKDYQSIKIDLSELIVVLKSLENIDDEEWKIKDSIVMAIYRKTQKLNILKIKQTWQKE